MSLLDDLKQGEDANTVRRPCQICVAIDSITDEETKQGLIRAAGGTIGRDKLVAILRQNGLLVGKRALERHRQEGHTS